MLISLQTSTAEDAQSHRLCWAIHPADLFTPVRAFRSLRAAGHHACLLESVEGPARLARWSFVGVNPGAHFRGGPEGCTLTTPEGTENLIGPSHEALREVARRYATAPVTQPGLPPFTGGWIGCFTYEWAASLEPTVPLPEDDPHGVGEAIFDHYSDLLAFDHASQRLILLAGCPRGADDYSAACERLERLAADLSADAGGRQGFRLLEDEPRAQTTRPAFEAGVERLQHEIGQGEIFQAVLSQRFEQRYEGDPFMLYRVLRLVNSAPHMFFFQADGLTLVGSSPERLASLTGGRLHIAHVSTKAGIDAVHRAKAGGLHVTCDTAPPYFALNENAIGDYRTFAKLSPPLRGEDDRQAVREAIGDGTVDVIASGHDPRGPEDKRLPFSDAEPGMAGAETLLAMTLSLVRDELIDIGRAFELVATKPAEILGVPAGAIAPGLEADVAIIDPDRPWIIQSAKMEATAGNTPFDGQPTQGRVLHLYKGGVPIRH